MEVEQAKKEPVVLVGDYCSIRHCWGVWVNNNAPGWKIDPAFPNYMGPTPNQAMNLARRGMRKNNVPYSESVSELWKVVE